MIQPKDDECNPPSGLLLNFELDESIPNSRTATWQHEAVILVQSSAPLVLTFILQYSLSVASIFVVGHIGEVELAAFRLTSSSCTTSFHRTSY
jgi:MATE family, multidrug and toxin extrusion protein